MRQKQQQQQQKDNLGDRVMGEGACEARGQFPHLQIAQEALRGVGGFSNHRRVRTPHWEVGLPPILGIPHPTCSWAPAAP